ncbi:MAG TPA: hypothetical protein DCM32_05020 [Xanthomonadaceae bacterium]|nr:hypothetical protein [Xanthomonadaceae bacterium]
MKRTTPRSALALAILVALAAPQIHAEERQHPHTARDEPPTLDELEVTSSPLANSVEQIARPVDVLAGEALDAQRAATLGETLDRLPGVQNTDFGPGVGRPVIRGLDGARVQVLANGLPTFDASTVSADHAITIEPFLADSIEVLKGPANLFFGSGAIGGAVNAVDNRIPRQRAERFISGRAEMRAGSANNEAATLLRLDGGSGAFAWHFDGLVRDTSDMDIPGFAYSDAKRAEEIAEGEDPSEFERDTLKDSATNTTAMSGGAAWLGERVFFGAALSDFATRYGVPGHAHGHGHGHGGGHAEEKGVTIDLDQQRTEVRGGINDLGFVQQISLSGVRNDYQHVEIEGNEVKTRFLNDAEQFRLEAVQAPIAGWEGAIGVQYGLRDFVADGENTYLSPTETRSRGLFLLQERAFGDFRLELGARRDDVDVELLGGLATRDFSADSVSAGLLWNTSEALQLTLNLDRAERAPTAEELYAEGAHIAMQSYVVGDPLLETERADRAELGARFKAERFELGAAVYRTEFSDFIYLAETGFEIDDLPVRLWTQADATFTGWEVEGTVTLAETANGLWTLRGFADGVRGERDNGGDLPRIAPTRVGLDLGWSLEAWRAGVGLVRHQEQDRVAIGETPTDAFTLLDAQVSYHWDTRTFGWEAYLKGSNLTDEDARLHTSFLKEKAPLMGRNLTAGLRVFF